MAVRRLDHVGVVVDDIDAATAFFTALGLTSGGDWTMGDERVDRIVGLDGVRCAVAMLEVPGGGRLELIEFHTPPNVAGGADGPSNASGLRHLCFNVEDLDATLDALRPHGGALVGEVVAYEPYRLCYLRGPGGFIVELAEGP